MEKRTQQEMHKLETSVNATRNKRTLSMLSLRVRPCVLCGRKAGLMCMDWIHYQYQIRGPGFVYCVEEKEGSCTWTEHCGMLL